MLIDGVIMNKVNKVVAVLETGPKTAAQLTKAGAGKGVLARISEARHAGVTIYSNRKTFANGRTSTVYRLGKPSKRFTRNMKAGRTEIAVRSLYTRAA